MDRGYTMRLLSTTFAAIAILIAWQFLPSLHAALIPTGEPRVVTPRGDLAGGEKSTIALFEATKSSVVFISTTAQVIDLWTRNVYEIPRGTGSGFVWDEKGHVVTNAHVVAGAAQAIVRLADGRTLTGTVVGRDAANDLAVLRLASGARAPAPLPIGTSGDLKVGQNVFAIGNPFGLDWTLTAGIVSALERELPNREGNAIRGLIQTDAAINPGNSGGPLIDSAGRLVGVNTAIYSPSGASAGIGFAIPVDTVNRVVPELIASGRYKPPTLGIAMDPQTDEILARAGLKGVLVLGVTPNSPAMRAGIKPARIQSDGTIIPGDIIVGLGGQEIDNVGDLRAALDKRKPGDAVEVMMLRNGERRQVTATLAAGA
jgi:S1-C subfamily serine protease